MQRSIRFMGVLCCCLFFVSMASADLLQGPSGEKLLTLGILKEAEMSPDGTRLAALSNMGVFVWNLEDGALVTRIDEEGVNGLTFFPDSRRILLIGKQAVVWDLDAGKETARFGGEPFIGKLGSISSDGQWFLYSAVQTQPEAYYLDLWNLKSMTREKRFGPYSFAVGSAVFSPDLKSIAVSMQGTSVDLLDISMGEKIQTYSPNRNVEVLAFSPDGAFLYTLASGEGKLRQWDTLSGEVKQTYSVAGPFALTAEGRTLIVEDGSDLWKGLTGNFHFVDSLTGEIVRTIPCPVPVSTIQLRPDSSHMLTSGLYGDVVLWDLTTGEILRYFGPFIKYIEAANYLPNGNDIGVADEFQFKIVDSQTQAVRRNIHLDNEHMAKSSFFSMDSGGHYLARVDGMLTLRVWSLDGMEMVLNETNMRGINVSAHFSKDGNRLLAGVGMTYGEYGSVWDMKMKDRILSLRYPDLPSDTMEGKKRPLSVMPRVLDWSPDEKWIVTGNQNDQESRSFHTNLVLWSAETGDYIRTYPNPGGYLVSATFSPDGESLLAGDGEGAVLRWNVQTGELVRIYQGPDEPVGILSCSPDSNYMISGPAYRFGLKTNQIQLWDYRTGEHLASVSTNHIGPILNAEFSPTQPQLMTAGTDGTIRLWDYERLLPASRVLEYDLHR